MGVKKEVTILKVQSKNSNCKDTAKWEQAHKVILLTTQNGGTAITDELPGGGIVKQRIATQEQKIRNNKFQSTIRILDSTIVTSSSSIENHNAKQVESQTPSLRRSNTNTSLFSNNSRRGSPKILKFDREGKLVILTNNHPFLEKIEQERRKIPQSYRNATRIDNLTDNEMDTLNNNYADKAIAVGKPSLKA